VPDDGPTPIEGPVPEGPTPIEGPVPEGPTPIEGPVPEGPTPIEGPVPEGPTPIEGPVPEGPTPIEGPVPEGPTPIEGPVPEGPTPIGPSDDARSPEVLEDWAVACRSDLLAALADGSASSEHLARVRQCRTTFRRIHERCDGCQAGRDAPPAATLTMP